MAPTAAGECTLVPIWYRFGSPDRALLVLRDGSANPLPFDGHLPEELGIDPGEGGADRGDAAVGAAAPADPGRHPRARLAGSVRRRRRPRGRQAGAVLFLFRDVEKRDDIEFVRGYRESTGGLEPSTAGAVGVLSHADVFGGGPWAAEDPVDAARRLAERAAADHAALLSAVVPVSGLLAEAVRTGRVTEDDSRALAGLADADPARLQGGFCGILARSFSPLQLQVRQGATVLLERRLELARKVRIPDLRREIGNRQLRARAHGRSNEQKLVQKMQPQRQTAIVKIFGTGRAKSLRPVQVDGHLHNRID